MSTGSAMETLKYFIFDGLAVECSRLLQSFTEKVKSGARAGTQYKTPEKQDWLKEIIPTNVYKQLQQRMNTLEFK